MLILVAKGRITRIVEEFRKREEAQMESKD
jgi:hypothetical protein